MPIPFSQVKTGVSFLLLLLAFAGTPASAQSPCDQLQAMDYRCDDGSFKTAVLDGDADAVRLFLQSGQSPNHAIELSTEAGDIAFPIVSFAIENGYVDIARALIDAGADINAHFRAGDARLGSNVRRAIGNPEMLRLVLDAGADMALPNSEGFRPIHSCLISEGAPHLESLRILLEYGADPNSPLDSDNIDWATPLFVAAGEGRKEAIPILIDFGADPTIQAPNGIGLPEIAEMRGHDDTATALREAIDAYE